MGHKLTGLIGITAAVLAVGITATHQVGNSQVQQEVRHAVLAEGKGPTVMAASVRPLSQLP
ncbi:hypothetical protein [Streptomyces sp. YGL11-2]|uniref:hypothetical protein n=1 Tax=Streptomyces sp. YGL11-2 TaxID=3414028 RepID=UPI003CFAFA5A